MDNRLVNISHFKRHMEMRAAQNLLSNVATKLPIVFKYVHQMSLKTNGATISKTLRHVYIADALKMCDLQISNPMTRKTIWLDYKKVFLAIQEDSRVYGMLIPGTSDGVKPIVRGDPEGYYGVYTEAKRVETIRRKKIRQVKFKLKWESMVWK